MIEDGVEYYYSMLLKSQPDSSPYDIPDRIYNEEDLSEKDIETLEKILDRLEDDIEQLEERIEQIELLEMKLNVYKEIYSELRSNKIIKVNLSFLHDLSLHESDFTLDEYENEAVPIIKKDISKIEKLLNLKDPKIKLVFDAVVNKYLSNDDFGKVIDRSDFKKLVNEILYKYSDRVEFTSNAIDALQEVAEDYLVKSFKNKSDK